MREFKDLPIVLKETERNGEWSRAVYRDSSIAELLETWNIDDPQEESEMAQVLRYLRDAVNEINKIEESYGTYRPNKSAT